MTHYDSLPLEMLAKVYSVTPIIDQPAYLEPSLKRSADTGFSYASHREDYAGRVFSLDTVHGLNALGYTAATRANEIIAGLGSRTKEHFQKNSGGQGYENGAGRYAPLPPPSYAKSYT